MEDLMFFWGSGRIEDVPVDWVERKQVGPFGSAPQAFITTHNHITQGNDGGHSAWGKALMSDTCKDDAQHWAIYNMGSDSES